MVDTLHLDRIINHGNKRDVPACISGVKALEKELKDARIKLEKDERLWTAITESFGVSYGKRVSGNVNSDKRDIIELEKMIPIEKLFDDFLKTVIETFHMNFIGDAGDPARDNESGLLTHPTSSVFKLPDVKGCNSGYIIIFKDKPYISPCSSKPRFCFRIKIAYIFNTANVEEVVYSTNNTYDGGKLDICVGDEKDVDSCWIKYDEFQRAQYLYLSNQIAPMFEKFMADKQGCFEVNFDEG